MARMLGRFLAKADVQRVRACFTTLRHHGIEKWALTGRAAIESRLIERGLDAETRPLNDLDFVTTSFDLIPNTLGTDFLVRHVHPLDPPDKIIAQFVSAQLALRVDVFRTSAEVMNHAHPVQTEFGAIPAVSLEDLVARAVRLTLPLIDSRPVPAKHASDLLRLLQVADAAEGERAWPRHRRTGDPESFRDAAALLREIISHRSDLLITPAYSRNPGERCSRCADVEGLELADPAVILSILGYC